MRDRTQRDLAYGISDGMTMMAWIITRVLLVYFVVSLIKGCTFTGAHEAVDFRSQKQDRLLASAKSSKDMYPNRVDALVVVNNRTHVLRLTKHLDLLAPSYKEIYFEDGKRVITSPSVQSIDFCYYEGAVESDQKSHAAINLCNDGISGTVYFNEMRYDISTNSTSHLLYLLPASENDDPSGSTFICGHGPKSAPPVAKSRVRREARQFPPYYKKYVNWKDLYVELAIVFDNSAYRTSGSDKKRLYSRAKEYANFVNSYYQPVNIKVALVGVEVWSGSDPITVTDNGDATLDAFLRYRRVNLLDAIPNDHAQLLTVVPFGGGVVGKAMKGTICSLDLSGAVINDHSRYPATVAATMAHEMGHNFGMEHDNDTCQCPQPKCLMAASASSASNMVWSSCSMEYLALTISHGGDFCLKNKPTRLFDRQSPVCGNGFVEDGEECDCGFPDVCDNPCCNSTTCRLAEGAKCADGGCCDLSKCQYKPKASPCRESRSECDLVEYCSGISEHCPNDTYKQNGIACSGGQAYCFNGNCDSHDSQCKLVWGPTGAMGENVCYTQLNLNGNMQGNCGYKKLQGIYTPCAPQDTMCGSLQCSQKTERTAYGDRSLVRMAYTEIRYSNRPTITCHVASIDLGSEENDPGLVPNGAKCGEGMMCSGRRCVDVKKVQAEKPCDSNCYGNGVCNNLGNCHCNVGFGGANCGSVGVGGSVDSGPASVGESTTIRTTPVPTRPLPRQTTASRGQGLNTSTSTVSAMLPKTTMGYILNDNDSLGLPVHHNTSDNGSDSGTCILFEACTGFNIGLGVLIFLIVILPLVSALLTYLYKKGKLRSPKVVKVFDKPGQTKSATTKPRPPPATSGPKAKPAATTKASQPTVPKPKQPQTTPAFPAWPKATTPCAMTDTSKSFPKPTVTVNLQDGILPVIAAIAASTTTLSSTSTTPSQPFVANAGPSRPRRPSENLLAKVHEIDETQTPKYDDVAAEDDDVILPRRAAPPPPPTAIEEPKPTVQPAPVLANTKKLFESIPKEHKMMAVPLPQVKKPTQSTNASNGDSSQNTKGQPVSQPLLPPLPTSKPKVVHQEDVALPKQDNDNRYTAPEKKARPAMFPSSKPSDVGKKPASTDSPSVAGPTEQANGYYDVVHSKPEPQLAKKEPVLPKKPLKPFAQIAKEDKPVVSPKPAASSTVGTAKAAFVADLEKKLKTDSGVPSSSNSAAGGKKALVLPTPNKKPELAKKNSGAKNDGLVSALAARFEKSQ